VDHVDGVDDAADEPARKTPRNPSDASGSSDDVWEVSDEALFAGYASGDPAAAAAFVRRVERKVYGLALAIVQDPADAQDVAQEALVRAWRFAASFDERRGSVMAWLLGITRNVALDNVRGQGRRPDTVGEAPRWVVDPTDVGEVAERHDDAARVLTLMRDLPDGQRDALVAVTLYGLTTREVSEQAGIPHGTVKTRVRLALRKLRDGMGVPASLGEAPGHKGGTP
jgi:RNA polymerase sigma factor (sigma-70 family)